MASATNIRPLEHHGYYNTPTYMCWQNMKARCYQKTNPAYDLYGARGITVSDDWKDSFIKFLEDMGERPSKDHTIDRIDVTLGYSKNNCRWLTKSEQMYNMHYHTSPTVGVRKYYNKWIAQISVKNKSVYLGLFSTQKEAIEARVSAEIKYWNRDRKGLVYGSNN